MKWILRISSCMLAALGLTTMAHADVQLNGNVRGVLEAAQNNYVVTGHITIAVNDTLKIEPGVILVFNGNYRMTVNGTLIADGTMDLPIDIRGANQRPAGWLGITVNSGSKAHFSYVSLRHAYQGINVVNCDPVIDHCTFSQCDNAAVRFSSSNGRLTNSMITDITDNGVAIVEDSRALVENDTIRRCGGSGIAVGANGIPEINNNYIADARDHGITLSGAGRATTITWNVILQTLNRGINVDQVTGVTIERNGIQGSGAVGIFVYRSTNVVITNNSVIGSGQHGIQFSNSSGRITNTIVGENSRSGLFVSGTIPQAGYNDYYSNSEGDYTGTEAAQGDLTVRPNLQDPAQGNFHPREDSPIIDRGDPNGSLDPDGTQADIGMWFYNMNHPPVIEAWTPQDSVFQYEGDRELVFNVQATDPDGHGMIYNWYINGVLEFRPGSTFRKTFIRDGQYMVQVEVSDQLYAGKSYHVWQVSISGSAVDIDPTLPLEYAVSEVYPNPFNGQSKVDLTLPVAGQAVIEVWDINGRLTATVMQGELSAGNHSVALNADALPTGRYFLVARMGGGSTVRSFVLLK